MSKKKKIYNSLDTSILVETKVTVSFIPRKFISQTEEPVFR